MNDKDDMVVLAMMIKKGYDDIHGHTAKPIQSPLTILSRRGCAQRDVPCHTARVADIQAFVGYRRNGTWWLQNPADAARSKKTRVDQG